MLNLIKMDLYRLFKSKPFIICLAISALLALASTPIEKAFSLLAAALAGEGAADLFDKQEKMSAILLSPLFPGSFGAILPFISLVSYYNADIEHGYIKNIAGQLPARGLTVFSKFFATIPHNLIFMCVGVLFNILGTMFLCTIVWDAEVASALGTFFIKLLLMQSVATLLVFVVSTLRLKSLGAILAVLMGSPMMTIVYGLISTLLERVGIKNFSLSDYMPDAILCETQPEILTAILSALIFGAIFLALAIRVFDRRDVK